MAAYKLNKNDCKEFIEEHNLRTRKFSPGGFKVNVIPMFRQWIIMSGKSDVSGIAKLSEKNAIKMLQELLK